LFYFRLKTDFSGKLHIYRNHIEAYCKSTGAARGLLVLMSSGKVIEAG
jgi:hypothetical protein